MTKGIAFFDFDGTIIRKDSFLEFFKFTDSPFKLYVCIAINLPFVLLFYLKLYSNHRLKERFFSFFCKGKEAKPVQDKGIAFGNIEIPKMYFDGAQQVIDWHRSQDHEIYIVSASASLWLQAWCDANQFKLICTKFEIKDGIFTGNIEGRNCYGSEKLTQIAPILAQNKGIPTYGYGDSKSDLHYISKMDFGFLMPLTLSNVQHRWDVTPTAHE